MSNHSNNFFNEFVQNGFFEKKASENENIKSVLSDLDPALLEKLAQDIDAISDISNDMTLEQKLASDCNEPKEEKESEDDSEKEESKEETKEEPKEEKESEDESEKEESKDEKEEPKEEKESEDDSEKEEPKEEKESEEEEKKEVIKQAYELAEQKLASSGLSISDFVLQKCANEDIAYFITENAEKLAFLSDRSTLQVADEIIYSLSEKLG